MSDLQKYITKRKKRDKEFAENYDEGCKTFKTSKNFVECTEKDDWEKAKTETHFLYEELRKREISEERQSELIDELKKAAENLERPKGV